MNLLRYAKFLKKNYSVSGWKVKINNMLVVKAAQGYSSLNFYPVDYQFSAYLDDIIKYYSNAGFRVSRGSNSTNTNVIIDCS